MRNNYDIVATNSCIANKFLSNFAALLKDVSKNERLAVSKLVLLLYWYGQLVGFQPLVVYLCVSERVYLCVCGHVAVLLGA